MVVGSKSRTGALAKDKDKVPRQDPQPAQAIIVLTRAEAGEIKITIGPDLREPAEVVVAEGAKCFYLFI